MNWRKKFAAIGLVACLSGLLFVDFVLAQTKPAAKPAAKSPGNTVAPTPAAQSSEDGETKVRVERGAGGKKLYRIEGEIRIEGKIQKPEAFYVLQKSGMNYDWQEMRKDFLPKIIESVKRAPF